MPRTAKRYLVQASPVPEVSSYRAGIYVRLSNERHESWREKSSSPQTQEELCRAYALKENISISEVYLDYEYSGSNFNRPAYQQMMADIRQRKINCILIKDLSRLGREHLEMGRLIDKVFPFLGVRFISVNDHLDTANGLDNNKSFEVMLKNIINDMYAKDISSKILSVKHQRARDGYFIGSVPPYGYRVEKTKLGQKLVPDENTTPILQRIFQMALDGMPQLAIARQLNADKITSPMVYLRTKRVEALPEDKEWNVGGLAKILTNPTYLGTLVQGVRQQNLTKGQKQRKMPKDKHIVAEHAHEALISQEVFDAVQAQRKKNKAESNFSYPSKGYAREPENRYEGLLFDGRTGNKMLRRVRYSGTVNERLLYTFLSHMSDGKTHALPLLHINEETLDAIVMENLSGLMQQFGSKKKILAELETAKAQEEAKLEVTKCQLQKRIQRASTQTEKLYEAYATGAIEKDAYLSKKHGETAKLESLSAEIRKLDEMIATLEPRLLKAKRQINLLFRSSGKKKPNAEMLQALIHRIDVQSSTEVILTLDFDLPQEGQDE